MVDTRTYHMNNTIRTNEKKEEIIKEVTISFDVFEASGEQPSAHELINSSYVRGPPALEEKYVKNVSFMLAVLTTNLKLLFYFMQCCIGEF